MSKRKTPPKVHLEMIEKMEAPACVRGRGPVTSDPEKVTCPSCRGSGTMSRLLMRLLREKAESK